ncbi:MAG: insulinase family protein [Candidatus Omnitrophica bacterium]|nr:insulinase family protein [Candidatus Omnitrophota bacterium]MCM8793347.1 insulinase family protein [Candidatus Omnitrophota bacterium]
MSYKKVELDNGLKIACLRMPNRESVSLGIWINAGGRYETEKLSGVSHFLEHLVFRGTKRRSARKIKEAIEGVGGMLNAFTAEEFTCYFVKIPAGYLELSLDVLSDIVLNARLDGEDLEKERKIILEEIKMYLDLPMHYVHELLNQLLWPKHPLGRFLCGTVESVSRIQREEIVAYRDSFYQPQHINVIACGAIDREKLVSLAKKYFSSLRRGERLSFNKVEIKQTKVQTNFMEKDTEQTHISLGVHGLSREHKDRYALALLHIILGANMSSRLFEEVREKRGLAYEIGTHLKKFQDTGAFIINAGVEHKKVIEAIKVIIEELRKIKKNPVKKSEFRRAKEYFTGQFLLSLEETMDHMLWLGENVTMLDKIYLPQEILDELNKTKIEDIQLLANSLFKTSDLNLALIGPISDKERREIENNLFL